jgi:hypothetical protein
MLVHGMRDEVQKVLFTCLLQDSPMVLCGTGRVDETHWADDRAGKNGAPGEIRTPDLLLRRQPLYPSELRARTVSTVYMGKGNSFNVSLPAYYPKEGGKQFSTYYERPSRQAAFAGQAALW